MAHKARVTLDKSSLKFILKAIDRYAEKHVFGSPVEEKIYDCARNQIAMGLLEYEFID